MYLFILKSRWPASLTPKCSGAKPFSLCSFTLSLSFCLLPKSEGWCEINMCHNSEQSGKIRRVCLCTCVWESEESCGYELLYCSTVRVWIIESAHYFEMPLSLNCYVSGSDIEGIRSLGKCEGLMQTGPLAPLTREVGFCHRGGIDADKSILYVRLVASHDQNHWGKTWNTNLTYFIHTSKVSWSPWVLATDQSQGLHKAASG